MYLYHFMRFSLVYVVVMGIFFKQANGFMSKNTLDPIESNLKFSYTNCGPASDPFKINLLNVQPDPIKLSGKINIDAIVDISSNITAPLIVNNELKFKEIPCINQFGSCTYPDVCTMLPSPTNCPEFFIQNKIPCGCPFLQGSYNVKDLALDLNLPDVIPGGAYEITANFQNGQNHVGCVQIDLNLA